MIPAKIYVGCWRKAPKGLSEVPLISLHPLEFKAFYDGMDSDGFTNNPTFLDHVSPSDVIVVQNDGMCVPLLFLPEIRQIGDASTFTPGELWSFTLGTLQI